MAKQYNTVKFKNKKKKEIFKEVKDGETSGHAV